MYGNEMNSLQGAKGGILYGSLPLQPIPVRNYGVTIGIFWREWHFISMLKLETC